MNIFLLVIVAATFALYTSFMYVYTAKRLLAQGLLPWDMKAVAYFWLVVGAVADVAFNWSRGCLIFRERPRKLFFSNRLQWHIDNSNGWRRAVALQWAAIINAVAPDHIKRTAL